MKKKLTALLLSLALCTTLMVPAFAADEETVDSSAISVSVTNLKPGYYMCAIWHGEKLLRLFDYTVGSDGKMETTVEIGEKLPTGETVTLGVSTANTGADPLPPMVCTVKNTSPDNPDSSIDNSGSPSNSSGSSNSGGNGGSSKPSIRPGVGSNTPAVPTTTPNGGVGFKDVAADAWYAPYVEYVAQKGLLCDTFLTEKVRREAKDIIAD